MRIREYVVALLHPLGVLMGTIVSIIFLIWFTYWPPSQPVAKALVLMAAILSFFIASYYAWKKERMEKEGLEQKRKELESKNQILTNQSTRSERENDVLKNEIAATRNRAEEQETRLNEQLKSMQDQLSELTKYQLKFEIKKRTVAFRSHELNGGPGTYYLSMEAALEFENTAPQPLRVIGIQTTLCERDTSGAEIEIGHGRVVNLMRNRAWEAWPDKGFLIPAAEGQSHKLLLDLHFLPRTEADLTPNHFIRITMDATNQPPYHQDIEIDWDELRQRLN